MNLAKKGQRAELLARKELEKEGWIILFKSQRVRFGNTDFYKLFDAIACKEHIWRFISFKHQHITNTGGTDRYIAHRKDIDRFSADFGLKGMEFWLWILNKGKWIKNKKDKSFFQKAHFEKIRVEGEV